VCELRAMPGTDVTKGTVNPAFVYNRVRELRLRPTTYNLGPWGAVCITYDELG
jgi:hypothetical protein